MSHTQGVAGCCRPHTKEGVATAGGCVEERLVRWARREEECSLAQVALCALVGPALAVDGELESHLLLHRPGAALTAAKLKTLSGGRGGRCCLPPQGTRARTPGAVGDLARQRHRRRWCSGSTGA